MSADNSTFFTPGTSTPLLTGQASSFAAGGGFAGAGSILGGLGAITGGIFGNQADQAAAQGDFAAAQAYQTGAAIAGEQEQVAKDIGRIQTYQIQRQVAQTTGQGYSVEAGGGFAAGTGTGYYLARQNAVQGGLAVGLNNMQTALQVGAFAEQKAALTGEAQQATAAGQAAQAAGTGSLLGGLFGGVAQIAGGIIPFL